MSASCQKWSKGQMRWACRIPLKLLTLVTFQSSDMKLGHGPSIEQKSRPTHASDRLRAYRWVYEQLPVNESRTRVLVLHSHSCNTAQVSCSLEVMTLDPGPSRAYMALSYVWGDAAVTEDIIVNGVSFAVTSNLALALRQIRKSFREVLLWADAICTYLSDTNLMLSY